MTTKLIINNFDSDVPSVYSSSVCIFRTNSCRSSGITSKRYSHLSWCVIHVTPKPLPFMSWQPAISVSTSRRVLTDPLGNADLDFVWDCSTTTAPIPIPGPAGLLFFLYRRLFDLTYREQDSYPSLRRPKDIVGCGSRLVHLWSLNYRALFCAFSAVCINHFCSFVDL